MNKSKSLFRVYKKKLSNGMNILVRPSHIIPEVVIQLWYNVGSKDEIEGERGMAHLIEHMIFKGTNKLSESDIDGITFKLSGYANAFTSNDYTGYIFKFPSNVWENSLKILSDCMINARFDEQMLNSELHAVIQELKLYKDDYQEKLIQKMLSSIFPQHSYRHPIIGYKNNLWDLNRDDLYRFYKKHYHPANATLVIVGDVNNIEKAFIKAEKYFGKIKSPKNYKKNKSFIEEDIFNSSVYLPREIDTPWAFYAYKIPGFSSGKAYLFDTVASLIARGRSSRLYERLVIDNRLVTFVGCFPYDLFEAGIFVIYVQPINKDSLGRIEAIIEEELSKIVTSGIEEWEFRMIKKKTEVDYYSLLESMDRQAEVIGSSFLATGDTKYLDSYMGRAKKLKRSDIQRFIKSYLVPEKRHKGYLLPANNKEKSIWKDLQKESDKIDINILKNRVRTTSVEGGKESNKIKIKKLPDFSYSIPKSFILDNNLEVIYLNKKNVPRLTAILGFKANYLYDPEELSGISRFTNKLLIEGTKKYPGKELSRYLELNGISISAESGTISLDLLSCDLDKGLDILGQIISEPEFNTESIEKIRSQTVMELQEFWDSPAFFSDLLARQMVYKGHPYSKFSLGYKECVNKFSRDNITKFYEKFISSQGAYLVLVGDLNEYSDKKIESLVNNRLGFWGGKKIKDIDFPEIKYKKRSSIIRKINRDQTVLVLAGPSISRLDQDYDAMAILDIILTGGGMSMSSRLFQLRDQTGLFYTIGGSLLYGAEREPGMVLIKTTVSVDKVEVAEKLIRKTVKDLQNRGISRDELEIARRSLISSSTRLFENNSRVAQVFLFMKRCGISFDLFDKRGALLSILEVGVVNNVARRYCRENFLSAIKVGR